MISWFYIEFSLTARIGEVEVSATIFSGKKSNNRLDALDPIKMLWEWRQNVTLMALSVKLFGFEGASISGGWGDCGVRWLDAAGKTRTWLECESIRINVWLTAGAWIIYSWISVTTNTPPPLSTVHPHATPASFDADPICYFFKKNVNASFRLLKLITRSRMMLWITWNLIWIFFEL